MGGLHTHRAPVNRSPVMNLKKGRRSRAKLFNKGWFYHGLHKSGTMRAKYANHGSLLPSRQVQHPSRHILDLLKGRAEPRTKSRSFQGESPQGKRAPCYLERHLFKLFQRFATFPGLDPVCVSNPSQVQILSPKCERWVCQG